ncbi:cytochrome C oxidase subunit IV family protein [bacterium]|nr:cytochrome C oxidase subunit IV family protein [bacterium]
MSDASNTHKPHVVDAKILIGVWFGLLFLTFVTVAATWIDLGALNIWLALGIATVKASLVAAYFMHLRYDKPFNTLVLIAALVFLMLFIGILLLDTGQYAGDIIKGAAPALSY